VTAAYQYYDIFESFAICDSSKHTNITIFSNHLQFVTAASIPILLYFRIILQFATAAAYHQY